MHANYSSGIHFWLRNDLTSYSGVGVRTCWPAEPNASGQPATLAAIGSLALADDDLRLEASGLSPYSFGYFITSRTENEVFPVANSAGRLCIGPSIGRQVGGVILNSGASGAFGVDVDLAAMPTPAGPVVVLPGDSWSMQAWFRDAGPVPSSNFSDAIRLQFE